MRLQLMWGYKNICYVTGLLLLLTNSKKSMYGQVLGANAEQLMSHGQLENAWVFI